MLVKKEEYLHVYCKFMSGPSYQMSPVTIIFGSFNYKLQKLMSKIL